MFANGNQELSPPAIGSLWAFSIQMPRPWPRCIRYLEKRQFWVKKQLCFASWIFLASCCKHQQQPNGINWICRVRIENLSCHTLLHPDIPTICLNLTLQSHKDDMVWVALSARRLSLDLPPKSVHKQTDVEWFSSLCCPRGCNNDHSQGVIQDSQQQPVALCPSMLDH